jgi:hypothetical protein
MYAPLSATQAAWRKRSPTTLSRKGWRSLGRWRGISRLTALTACHRRLPGATRRRGRAKRLRPACKESGRPAQNDACLLADRNASRHGLDNAKQKGRQSRADRPPSNLRRSAADAIASRASMRCCQASISSHTSRPRCESPLCLGRADQPKRREAQMPKNGRSYSPMFRSHG